MEVARAICLESGLDPDMKFKSSDWSERTAPHELAWHAFQPEARAAIAIVVERCAGICEQAAVEADEKLNQAETENSARNFASAHATSKVLAMAIKALAEEQA